MKQNNVSLILKILHEYAPLSRARIAELSGLTPACITKISQEMIECKLLHECGIAQSKGGRPGINLAFRPGSRILFGICFSPSEIEIIATDFAANIVDKQIIPLRTRDALAVVEITAKYVRDMIKTNGIRKKDIVGVGLVINGVVDTDRRISVFAPHYGWKNVPVAEILESSLHLPVLIENDTNAMAVAERWFGTMRDLQSPGDREQCFIALNIGKGVGAGIMINDRVYHGYSFGAGEIGHIIVEKEGPQCSCGKRGCLEALVSSAALERKAAQSLHLIHKSANRSLYERKEKSPFTIEAICHEALVGNSCAVNLLEQAGIHVGLALVGTVAALNPSHIIIGGDITKAGDIFINAIIQTIQSETMDLLSSSLTVTTSSLGENRATLGAAAMVFSGFISSGNICP